MGAGNGGAGTILRVQSQCLLLPASLLGTRLVWLTAGPSPAGKATFASSPSAKSTPAGYTVLHPLPNPSLLSFQPLSLSSPTGLASAISTTSHQGVSRPQLFMLPASSPQWDRAPSWVLVTPSGQDIPTRRLLDAQPSDPQTSHHVEDCRQHSEERVGQPRPCRAPPCWPGARKRRGERVWSQRKLGLT